MTGPMMPTRPPASAVRPQTPEAQRAAGTVVGHAAVGRRRAPKPVFVDRSGKRRRIFVVTGAAAAVVVVLALVSLVGGLLGGSPLPLPGLPNLVNPAPPQPAPQSVTTATRDVTGGSSAGAPSGSARPTSTPTSPRHTPTDHGKPTKT
jgi:hypothetical protein